MVLLLLKPEVDNLQQVQKAQQSLPTATIELQAAQQDQKPSTSDSSEQPDGLIKFEMSLKEDGKLYHLGQVIGTDAAIEKAYKSKQSTLVISASGNPSFKDLVTLLPQLSQSGLAIELRQ